MNIFIYYVHYGSRVEMEVSIGDKRYRRELPLNWNERTEPDRTQILREYFNEMIDDHQRADCKQVKVPDNFIDKVLDYTQHAESPTSYFEFAALTTIAAVLRDNVYIKFPHYTLYPNLYTILLSAESSNTRKSVPLNLVKALVRRVDNTHVFEGTATMPAIVQTLGEHFQTKAKKVVKGASGIIVASELTSFMSSEFKAVETLTDLFDAHDTWKSITKHAGSPELERVCLSMIGGTNEALVNNLYDESAKEGGLLARSCIVYEKRRRHMNSLEYDLVEPKTKFEDLAKDLAHISTLSGEIKRGTDARKTFDDWYRSSLSDESLTRTGAEGRIHDIVRKIAMLLCVAELPPNDKKILTTAHIERAIGYGNVILNNQREFSLGAGSGPGQKALKIVLKILLLYPGQAVSRKKLLQSLLGDVDLETLDKIIDYGVQAKLMAMGRNSSGEIAVSATPELIEMVKTKAKEKEKEKEKEKGNDKGFDPTNP